MELNIHDKYIPNSILNLSQIIPAQQHPGSTGTAPAATLPRFVGDCATWRSSRREELAVEPSRRSSSRKQTTAVGNHIEISGITSHVHVYVYIYIYICNIYMRSCQNVSSQKRSFNAIPWGSASKVKYKFIYDPPAFISCVSDPHTLFCTRVLARSSL